MEASRVAALRGHEVILVEKENRWVIALSFLDKRIRNRGFVSYNKVLQNNFKKLGVKIITKKEADTNFVSTIKPDVIILACGGKFRTPETITSKKKKIITVPELHKKAKIFLRIFGPRFLGWLTRFWLPMGKKVAIVGGSLQGCELAEFLVKRNREVTIIEESGKIGEGVVDFRLALLLDWFSKKGVKIYKNAKVEEINDEGVVINQNNQQILVPADTIIILSPLLPNIELYNSFKRYVKEIYAIGDCKEPSLIVDAIHQAWEIVRHTMTIEDLQRKIVELEQKIKELESRVQILEDINEIKELQRRYVDALICTEWDECAECFSEDAVVDVYLHKPVHGKENIRRWFKEELSKTHAGKEGDFVVHPIVKVEGDKAKGRWLLYMMYMYPRTGQSLFWVQGYYKNEYVREKGKWKISLMTWTERLGLPGGGPPTGLW